MLLDGLLVQLSMIHWQYTDSLAACAQNTTTTTKRMTNHQLLSPLQHRNSDNKRVRDDSFAMS